MKKLITLLSAVAIMLAVAVCFSASAAEERVVIDNVVYELTSEKYINGRYDYGEHYAVTDFFEDETLAETTTKINIVDEIDGIEVVAIVTNFDEHDGDEIHYARHNDKYSAVKRVTIPGTVKYISDYAFNFFPNVEKLYLPAELERIGFGTFKGMESLKSITLPVGVTDIPEQAFWGCTNLEKAVLNGDVTSIGDLAFCGCEKLSHINFPDSIKYLGDSAFSKTAITKAIVAENVDGDEGGAFDRCSKLEKIVYEDTSEEKVEYVGYDYFFWNCENVKAIYIKTIPTKGIRIENDLLKDSALLKDIYFAGSEEMWIELTRESEREQLEEKDIIVHFYYKHTHSFTRNGDPTCTKGGKFTYSCECGDTQTVTLAKNPDNHSYGSWKTVKKATYADYGTKQRTCKNCGKVEKAKIKKLVFGELQNLTATVSGNDVILTWDALEGATGYRVYIYDKDKRDNIKLASFKGKTTYTVSDLEVGETYTFRVKPYNKTSDGKVTWSKSFPVVVTVQ